MVIFSKTGAKAAVPASITERHMRYRLTLAVAAALVGGSSIAAYAQAPAAQAPAAGAPAPGFPGGPAVVNRGGGVAGTGIGARAAGADRANMYR